MKKLLFATVFASTAIASSMGCNADSLTGLHFGLGVSVLFDKYEADVDVGTSVPYAKHLANMNEASAVKVVAAKQLIKEIWMLTPALANSTETTVYTPNRPASITGVYKGWPNSTELTNGKVKVELYGESNVEVAPYYASRALFIKNHTFKKRTTNCGGEIKLAYFHDFGNHLMIGVDLTGVIASKNKKTIQVMPTMPSYPELEVYGFGDTVGSRNILGDVKVTANNGSVAGLTDDDSGTGKNDFSAILGDDKILSVGTTFKDLVDANPDCGGVFMDCVAYDEGAGGKADNSFNEMALVASQPNIPGWNSAASERDGTYTQQPDPAELTFEKSVFNPRLAFIVGGTVYGWFAGLRLGMSYTTGKVYATGGKLTGQGTNSKTVSISSPLIGLHLMKQMKIAGNNDAHLYLTADWNIGDGRRSVYMNGVRNFKQSGYQISAGLTWRFKLGN